MSAAHDRQFLRFLGSTATPIEAGSRGGRDRVGGDDWGAFDRALRRTRARTGVQGSGEARGSGEAEGHAPLEQGPTREPRGGGRGGRAGALAFCLFSPP